MALPTKSFRPAPIVDAALANNGGGRGLSHRLAQVSDRYLEALRRARASWPPFSEAEWSLLRDAMNGTLHEPAAMIAALDQGIEDAIALDGLDAKWSVDGPALLAKLRGLDFMQEVALVEAVERWWAERSQDDGRAS